MGHTSRCSNAQTDRCNCSCNGALHGGGTSLLPISSTLPVQDSSGSPAARSSHMRSTGKRRRRAASRAKSAVEDWLAVAAVSPPDSLAAATDQTIDMISDAVANAVVDALNRNGYKWTDADHVVCEFLAAAARAMQETQDRLEEAVAHMVSVILTARRRGHRPVIPEPLVTIASQAAVNALMKLSVTRQFDDVLRATRILAIMKCPAPEQHRAVMRYCVNPLSKEILSAEIQRKLTGSLPENGRS
jgi:hypothetical protein